MATQPSLAMIPAGYKATKLYSQLPVDGVGDFTVDRNSVATRVNADGLIEEVGVNIPRLDYFNGSCPELLVEPQSTNLITYSEDLTDASWVKNQSSITSNSTTSPDGTVNADLITKDGTNANDRVEATLSVSNTTDYTISVFIKNNDNVDGSVTTLGFRISAGTLFRQGIEWNGSVPSLTNTSSSGTRTNAKIESYINDWYRVSFGFESDGTSGDFEVDIDRQNGTNTTSIYAWGFELKQESFLTSYIKTSGSTVTRLADEITGAGDSSTFNSSEGVLYAEILKKQDDNDNFVLISINNSSDNNDHNTVTVGFDNADHFFIRVKANNIIPFYTSDQTASKDVYYKIALSYKSGDSKIYINGNSINPNFGSLSNTFSFGSTLNNLSFDFDGNGVLPFYGRVKQILVFNEALSDAELTSLTS